MVDNICTLFAWAGAEWRKDFLQREFNMTSEQCCSELELSNKQGKATEIVEKFCRKLIEVAKSGDFSVEGDALEAYDFLEEIQELSEWALTLCRCTKCGKEEIAFFSKEELENLKKHSDRQMSIQEAIPDKPKWIREVFVSGMCMCPDCWNSYFGGPM